MKHTYKIIRGFFTTLAWLIGLIVAAMAIACIIFILQDLNIIKDLQTTDLSKPHDDYD